MKKWYKVVYRNKQIHEQHWSIYRDDIQLHSKARRIAKDVAIANPRFDVAIWVDFTITEQLERIQ